MYDGVVKSNSGLTEDKDEVGNELRLWSDGLENATVLALKVIPYYLQSEDCLLLVEGHQLWGYRFHKVEGSERMTGMAHDVGVIWACLGRVAY